MNRDKMKGHTMMREVTEQELFEKLPAHKAVATLAIPTING